MRLVERGYVESTAGIAGGPKAFNDLESRLATLKGRKFYGTFHYPHGPYRACVALQEDDDAGSLGLATWVIPGGKCARKKLNNWSERPQRIGEDFAILAEQNDVDPRRPSIEFYRSHREVILLLPIR